MNVSCPHCKSKFKGKTGLSGKTVACPRCKHRFQVPREPAPSVPAPESTLVCHCWLVRQCLDFPENTAGRASSGKFTSNECLVQRAGKWLVLVLNRDRARRNVKRKRGGIPSGFGPLRPQIRRGLPDLGVCVTYVEFFLVMVEP